MNPQRGGARHIDIAGHLTEIIGRRKAGQATEHSHRLALERLFQSIDPALSIINEPKRSEAGRADVIFQRQDVPVGWVEAKDVDKDIIKLKGCFRKQRQRYENALSNLMYSNGVDWEFIRKAAPQRRWTRMGCVPPVPAGVWSSPD